MIVITRCARTEAGTDVFKGKQARVRIFQYGITGKKGFAPGFFTWWFCTEMPDLMTHWPDNYATMGSIRTIMISNTLMETRMKSAVKTKAHKDQPWQGCFGGSSLSLFKSHRR
jgi:hypothetical protein